MNKRKFIVAVLLFVILIMTVPVALNYLLPLELGYDSIKPNTTSSLWLGYWGSIIGAIIGAGATFIVLRYTIRNNETNNAKNLEFQIKIVEHNDYIKWLDEIKGYLVDIKVCLDYHSLLTSINFVKNGETDKVSRIASEKISRINHLHYRMLLNLKDELKDKDFIESLRNTSNSYSDILHCFVLLSHIHNFFNSLNEDSAKKKIIEYLKVESKFSDMNRDKLPNKCSFIENILNIPEDVPFQETIVFMEEDFFDHMDQHICPNLDKLKDQTLLLIAKLEQRLKMHG